MAMKNVEALVNIYNSARSVLRRFRFIDRVTTPIRRRILWIGRSTSHTALASRPRIAQYDCGEAVGTSHDEMNYYRKCYPTTLHWIMC